MFCKHGNIEAVEFLLENYKVSKSLMALGLKLAIQKNDNKLIKKFLQKGVDVNTCNGILLRKMCDRGNIKMVKYLLDNNARIDYFYHAPLAIASLQGNLEIVKLLLEKEADPTLLDSKAVVMAIQNGHTEVF